MTTGELIRKFRKIKGLTQHQLAQLIDLEGPNVSRWERGENRPNAENIRALAKALDVTVSDLVGDQPHPMTAKFNALPPAVQALALALGEGVESNPDHQASLERWLRIQQQGDEESKRLADGLLRRIEEALGQQE